MNAVQDFCPTCAMYAQEQEVIHKTIPMEECLPSGMSIKSIRRGLIQHAYMTHDITCGCPLCDEYLDELADIAAHGPLDENFDPADGAYIPEDK